MNTENKFFPTTYWEDRAAQTDGCLLRVISILGDNFPMLKNSLANVLFE